MSEIRAWKFEETKPNRDSVARSFKSWEVIHYDEGGHTESEIEFLIYKDGSLMINGHSDLIYLYPAQIEHLKFVLAELADFDKKGTE